MSRRFANNDAYLGDALSHIRDEDLAADVEAFRDQWLSEVDVNDLRRAAIVGKHPKTYEDISRGTWTGPTEGLVELDPKEKEALLKELESAMPEPGMVLVILAVSLAAFLQGHVQTSINGASLYRANIGLPSNETTFGMSPDGSNTEMWMDRNILRPSQPSPNDWLLGITNAAPFFSAALLGCWMALPFSDRFGRKGSMIVAAAMVMVTSALLAMIPVISTSQPKWQIILGIRIVNGIGMGIKAVNTPVLASETAVGYWRGTSILAWQLWVACGIFVGFILNLCFSQAKDENLALALILGAPVVPSIVLLGVLAVCPESPRYYLRRGPNYNPKKAYEIIKTLRRSPLIALRDIYLLHKSIQQEVQVQYKKNMDLRTFVTFMETAEFGVLKDFVKQFRELFAKRRNRNPLISSSIAALAQQLCGINILAFYSGTFFNIFSNNKNIAMYFSIGFGFLNFVFALPAIRRIDTMGRRRWLLITLPFMSLMMAAAALSFLALNNESIPESPKVTCALIFLYTLTEPGPIPFTLAAESFPLSHREIGCAFAISVNLFFAACLSLFWPSLIAGISSPGTLGLFSFFNVLAWVLVFLFVEETRRISLEDLDYIYAVSKSKFWKFQLYEYAPWVLKGFVLSIFGKRQASTDDATDDESISQHPRHGPRPQLYKPPDFDSDQLDQSGSEVEMDDFDPDGISEVSRA
ncbi:hypothetical protein PFICI_10932 [Pestalotiopsis fici W106-1]|uniref:Major facilitator superfamily (MFS) profile domain-containing protein n=1 Tax=Pestalotiopsis fici (strain W106-1 / CGMCC3.15140) TaxID=1229662 RepID=W3WT59_PESFW|nr:uncharacterized protein PFICI_10932 [Pestalotiopsis fici W106-1]ETS77058.1 hypothetical protein PFICI_10932 [Pestalotiopsis fici W106-1]